MPFITTWRAHLRKPSFIVHLASIECQILVEEVCDQLSLINVYMYVCVLSCCSHVQLWDPMNCSPTGSSVHGDSPGKNTGVGFHAFLSCAVKQKLLQKKTDDLLSREQNGRGRGKCGVHLSLWIHQEYTFRHRSVCRTPAESRQGYLTSGKDYIEPSKTW